MAATGNALVSAARVGRLLGRSGMRIARQVPALAAVEQQTQRLLESATSELARLLNADAGAGGGANPEEQRVMRLVEDAATDPAPLRTAMTELLDRSSSSDGARGRDYLFGTIVSQLVPDEARILAALGEGRHFAVVDVTVRQGSRSAAQAVLQNASTVGDAAGVSLPEGVGTYLTRLESYGLVEFARPEADLDPQFRVLESDPRVRAAKAEAERSRQGTVKLDRKSLTLSPLGQEFWHACAPTSARPGRSARRGG